MITRLKTDRLVPAATSRSTSTAPCPCRRHAAANRSPKGRTLTVDGERPSPR